MMKTVCWLFFYCLASISAIAQEASSGYDPRKFGLDIKSPYALLYFPGAFDSSRTYTTINSNHVYYESPSGLVYELNLISLLDKVNGKNKVYQSFFWKPYIRNVVQGEWLAALERDLPVWRATQFKKLDLQELKLKRVQTFFYKDYGDGNQPQKGWARVFFSSFGPEAKAHGIRKQPIVGILAVYPKPNTQPVEEAATVKATVDKIFKSIRPGGDWKPMPEY